jgi:hypothetical protein
MVFRTKNKKRTKYLISKATLSKATLNKARKTKKRKQKAGGISPKRQKITKVSFARPPLRRGTKIQPMAPIGENKATRISTPPQVLLGPGLFKRKCSKKIYKNVDLNNIKFERGDFTYYDVITRKKYILSNATRIAGGSYGTVYKFHDDTNSIFIAGKSFNNQQDKEFKIINALIGKNKMVDCNVLNARIVNTSGRQGKMVVSEVYNGSLTDLFGKITPELCFKIIQNLAGNFKCLLDAGHVYTDIKGANILYKCIDKDNIKVTIADLGSICVDGPDAFNGATYPPFEFKEHKGEIHHCSEKVIVWGLGVLFIMLLSNHIISKKYIDSVFYWNTIGKTSANTINKVLDRFAQQYPGNIGDLAKGMLEIDPRKRMSLDDIIQLNIPFPRTAIV